MKSIIYFLKIHPRKVSGLSVIVYSLLAIVYSLFTTYPSTLLAEADSISAAYDKAAGCYHDVRALPEAEQSRARWHQCITLFDEFIRHYARSEKAPDAIYSAGLSYRRLYSVSENDADAKSAVGKFSELVRMFPESSLADDALYNIGTLKGEVLGDGDGARKAMLQIIRWHPEGDMAANARAYLEGMEGGDADEPEVRKPKPTSKYVKLSKIEKSDIPGGEKILLTMSGHADFRENQGPHTNPNLDLYTLELKDTFLSRMLESGYSYVGKGVVRDIKPSQVNKNKAEINLVIRDGNHCLASGREASIEIICRAGPQKKAVKVPPVAAEVKTPVETPPKPQQGLSIVIDPGHGGNDFGAVGKGGSCEKDVALQIAKRLGWQLRNKLGADVNYTRIEDRTLSLDDRSAIANGFDADLFISIHANASDSPQASGYQTLFLNNNTDEAAKKLAAFENASLGKDIDDVEKIILTILQNINTDQSRSLARSVHKNVLSGMSRYALRDMGVKSGLFYVLARVKCPGILIETSFISNPEEEKRLSNPEYQENMARTIAGGIKGYLTDDLTHRRP